MVRWRSSIPPPPGVFWCGSMGSPIPAAAGMRVWFYQDYTGTGVELMFHALLGAITSGIPARVYVTGRCDLNGYSEISSASISR